MNNSRFWAQISRELRTPLNVVIGMAGISKDEIYDIEKVQYGLGKIEDSSRILLNLVNEVIDYSAIENDTLELVPSKFNLKDMITGLTISFFQKSKANNVHFDIHVQGVTQEILLADEHRLTQVLTCLLNHVLNNTLTEGKIDFSVHQISTSGKYAYIRFGFQTTGMDLSSSIINDLEINEEALYLNDAFEENLSLYICKYLLNKMNAKMEYHNQNGDGCALFIDIPLEMVEDGEKQQEVDFFGDEKILLVEDSNANAKERGKMLEAMGISYDVATKSDQALDMIGMAENDKKPYCMCILDWYSSGIRIVEFVREIRSIFGKEIVIVATAYDASNKIEEARTLGINYVIEKTWFRSTLFDALMKIKSGIVAQQEEKDIEYLKYNFSGKRILVAEDIELNMEVIVKILSKVNITVTCAENGMEAVSIFQKKPEYYFDAILMDINMPVLDGYQATKIIRNSEKEDGKTIPIYAMTANAFTEDVAQALASGMDGHISKPIEIKKLYSILENLFHEENELGIELRKKAEELQLQNEELRKRAEHDSLTDLLNRHAFEIKSTEYMLKQSAIGFLLADIDNFKDVNDTYGHDIGDEVLIKVAHKLKETFRASDDLFRFGGDEFAVIFSASYKDTAFIKDKIEKLNEKLLQPDDGLPAVSISAGVVFSDIGYTSDMYRMADEALYEVKNNGRCGCFVYDKNDSYNVERNWNKAFFGETIYYAMGDNGVQIENRQSAFDVILKQNKPVGIVCGLFSEGYPIYSISEYALQGIGYSYEEFLDETGGRFEKLVYIEDKKYLLENIKENEVHNKLIRLNHKDAGPVWFDMVYTKTTMSNGQKAWMASLREVVEDKVSEICDFGYYSISLIDRNKGTIVIEKRFVEGTIDIAAGKTYNYAALIQMLAQRTIKQNERENFIKKASLETVTSKLASSGLYEFIVYHKNADDTFMAIRHRYKYQDKTESKIICIEEIVEKFAETDDLTDLYNERGFTRTVAQILQANKDKKYMILYFNIKGFKGWNEILGHYYANKLLVQVTESLQNAQLNPLAMAREYADHITCLINKDDFNLNKIKESCKQKIVIDGSELLVQLHCGIYEVEPNKFDVRGMCDKAKLAESLIENSVAAPCIVFDEEMNQTYIQKISLLNNLGKALSMNQFKVHYHPIVEAKTGNIIAAEALIRWEFPNGKMVNPGFFIPALEEKGYISDLDLYVANTVQKFIYNRLQEQKNVVPVSINISRMDFFNNRFLSSFMESMRELPFDASYLRVEVTESSYVDIGESGESVLSFLRRLGNKVLIDDFGTGVSSLSNIMNMGFDIIKIDMVFIKNIGKNRSSEVIIKSIIETSHQIHVAVVAEGVETEQQYQFLLDNGCDYIQGYYFYKPLSEAEFTNVLNEKR